MARNAEDLAMLLSVIAGYDARVPTSIRESGAQFTAPLSRDFKGVRVAYSRDFGGYLPFEEGVLELCDRAAEAIRALGCEVEYAAPAYPIEKVWENWLVLRASQVAAKLGEFYADERKREMLKPEAQWEVERAHRITAVDLARASAARPDWYHAVREMFESFDYWILPAAQVFPFDASIRWPASVGGRAMDTYHRWMEVMIPVTMSGCPAVAVPAGFGVNGLPAGIQIVAPNHSEFACLQIAHAYENATGWTRNHLPPILA
jgi:amidase